MRKRIGRPNENFELPLTGASNPKAPAKKEYLRHTRTLSPVLPKFVNRIFPKSGVPTPPSMVREGGKWLSKEEIRHRASEGWVVKEKKAVGPVPNLITHKNGGLFQSPVLKQPLPKKSLRVFHNLILKKPSSHKEREIYVERLNAILKSERDLLIEIDFESNRLSVSNLPVLRKKLEHAIRFVDRQVEMRKETAERDEIADLEDKRSRMQNMLDLVDALS